MERDQATRMMQTLLKKLVAKNGSDLFITAGFPPAIKIDGEIHRDHDLEALHASVRRRGRRVEGNLGWLCLARFRDNRPGIGSCLLGLLLLC